MLNRLQGVFSSLQKHRVEYVVIGGVAAILHGVPRVTLDLDILIEATDDNAIALLTAFLDAGLMTAELTTAEALLRHEITIFKDKVRIDVQTATPGIEYGEVKKRRVEMTYQGQSFYILNIADLIASKKAAGRPQDLEDVKILELKLKSE